MRIDDNIGLALNYAYKFSRGVLHLRKEMISEALWILTEADSIFNDRHDNFVGYLKVKLRCGLIDFIKAQESLIPYEDLSASYDNNMGMFLRDLFATDFFTIEEQGIILKRLEDYTDQEIADLCGVSQTIIYRKRQAICHKIEQKGKDYGLERSKKSVPAES